MSQRSSITHVSAIVEHVRRAQEGIEISIRTENTMILLYKTGLEAFNTIVKFVRPTLRLGHVSVEKVIGDR